MEPKLQIERRMDRIEKAVRALSVRCSEGREASERNSVEDEIDSILRGDDEGKGEEGG